MIEIKGLSSRLLEEVRLIYSRYPSLVNIEDADHSMKRKAIIYDGCPIIYKYYGMDGGFRFELGSHLSECFDCGDYMYINVV